MLRVYSEYYYRTYSAPLCSFASFCCLISFLVAIFVPFMVLIISPQFWLFTSSTYEQPKVLLTGEYYLNVLTTESSKSYCSIASIHKEFSDQGLALSPIIQATQDDINNDGYNDFINLKITVPTNADLVRQVNLMIGLDYGFLVTSDISMNSVVFMNFATSSGTSRVSAIGEIQLTQREPLYPTKTRRVLYESQKIFDVLGNEGYQAAFDAYHTRNDTLYFSGTKGIGVIGNANTLEIDVKLTIPAIQEILYQQPLFEVMKFAWVQYVAFFVTIYMVIHYAFLVWVYKNKGLLARGKNESTLNSIEKLKKY